MTETTRWRYATCLLALLMAVCLVLFGWLQLHNQSQTEYLIFFDFWRNWAALKEGVDLYPFFYHNVHTYAVPSAVWYTDVLLANGTLKFVHGYVLVLTLAALICAAVIVQRLYRDKGTGVGYAAFAVLLTACMWLSPSNADSFAYPLVDILAATLLLLVGLTVIVRARIEAAQQAGAKGGRVATLAYIGVVSLAFLTLQTFLVVPSALALEALVRGRRRDFLLHAGLVVFWLALYLLFMRDPHVPPQPEGLNLAAIAHNFLVFLSSHFVILFQALGIELQLGARIGQVLSVLQLVALVIFSWGHYVSASRYDPWFRFPMLLAVLGMTAIFLAVLLRSGSVLMYDPVPRYTPYTLMFSVAVLLLAIDAIRRRVDVAAVGLGVVIAAASSAYVLAEAGALLLLSHNGGRRYVEARLEMPVYAIDLGRERGLGPVEPDEGLAWRANVHPFLKDRALAVFASEGYRALGMQLDTSAGLLAPSCREIQTLDTSRGGGGYRRMTFEGVAGDGYFVVLDDEGRVASFSFVARATPLDRVVSAQFAERFAEDGAIYFIRAHGEQASEPIRCVRLSSPPP